MINKSEIKYNFGYNYGKLKRKSFKTDSDNDFALKLLGMNNIESNFSVGKHNGISISKSQKALNQIDAIQNILNNGGDLYGMDLETIGDIKDGASDFEKLIFTTTEAVIKRNNITIGPNGLPTTTNHTVKNLVFGINEDQAIALKRLVNIYRDNERELTSAEKSTLKRMARSGASLNSNGQFNKIDGQFVISGAETYNAFDVLNMEKGINEHRRIGKLGYTFDNINHSSPGRKAINAYLDDLEKFSSNGNIMVGYNSHEFDMKVMKGIADKIGRPFNLGEGSIDLFEIGKNVGFDFTSLYENSNIHSNFSRQENLATIMNNVSNNTLFGGTDFHNAGFDVDALLGLTMNPIKKDNKGSYSLIDLYKNKAQENTQVIKDVKNNDVFRVAKPLSFQTLDGKWIQDGDKTLDFVQELSYYNEKYVNPYKQSTLLSQNYYKFNGLQEINVADLPQEQKIIAGNSEKLYAARFSRMYDKNSTEAVIIRKNIEDIQAIFENNLELSSDIRKTILSEHKTYELDQTRRIVEGFKEVNRGGYNEAKKYYSTYNKFAKEFEHLDEDLTKSIAQRIINEGEVTTSKGNVIKAHELLKPLSNPSTGTIYGSQVDHFLNMFNYLDETAPLANEIMEVVDKEFGNKPSKLNHANKTMAFSKAWGMVEDDLATDLDALELAIKKNSKVSTIKKSMSIPVTIDGETSYIDATTKENIRKSVKKITESKIPKAENTKTYSSSANKKLNEIYDQLVEKGVISKDEKLKLEEINHQNFAYGKVSDNIFENVNSKIDKLTNDQLLHPEEAKDKIKNTEKRLKEDDKNISKKLKKFKQETEKYSPNTPEGKENLKKDIDKYKVMLDKANREKIEAISKGKVPSTDSSSLRHIKKEHDKLEKYQKLINKQASAKENIKTTAIQSKQLDWVIKNTGAKEVEGLDVNNGPKILLKTTGETAPFKNFKDYINPKNADIKKTATKAIYSIPRNNEDLSFKKVISGKDYYKNDEQFKAYLKAELNYTQDEADTFSTILSGPKGILRKDKEDLAFSIVEQVDDINPDKKIAKMIIAKKDSINSVLNSAKNNDFGTNSISIDLPVAKMKNGIRIVEKGGLTRVDYSGIDLFTKPNLETTNDLLKVNVTKKSLISSTLSTLRYNADQMVDAIEGKRGEVLSGKFNKNMNNVFTSSPAPTGYKYIKKGNEVIKEFIGNAGDLSKNYNYDVSSLINFMPFLYDENENFRKHTNDILMKDKITSDSAETYFKKWKKDLLQGSGSGYGSKKTLDTLNPGLSEYFTVNLLGGEQLMDKIVNSEFIKKMNISDEMIDVFKDISENGSQVISESKVSELMVSTKSAEKFTAFGDIVGVNRPTIVQSSQYEHIQIDSLDDEYIKRLKSRGISFGRTLEGKDMSTLLSNSENQQGEFIEGITAKFKTITDKEILKKIDLFNSGLDENYVKTLKEKIAKENKNHPLLNLSDNEIMERIKKQSRNLEAQSSTFMQRTMVSPLASKMLSTDTYHDVNLKDVVDLKINVGDSIKHGDIIGLDKEGKEIIYSKKRAGKIIGNSEGKLHVQEFNPAIEEIKLSSGTVEKGVAHVFRFDDDVDLDIAQDIWENIYGKDVTILGDYELQKHLSASFAYDDITTIGQKVLDSNDNALIEEFREQLDSISGIKGSTEIVERFKGEQKTKAFLYNINKNDEDVFKKYDDVIAHYQGMATKSDKDFYKNIQETIKKNHENKENIVSISKMQLNRQYSSQTDSLIDISEIAGKHGGKMAYRDLYHFERKVGKTEESRFKYMKIKSDGTAERVSKPLVDHFKKELSKTEEYQNGLEDLNNIRYSTGINLGKKPEDIFMKAEWAENLKLAQIKLDEVRVHGSNFDIEDIQNTIFGEYRQKGFNAIEIDMGDFFVKNPLYSRKNKDKVPEMINKVVLPVTHNNFVDGIFMPHEVQKKMTDFINNAQLATQNVSGGISPFEAQKRAEQALLELNKAYDYEFKNKNGILRQKLLNGRINYSGHQLFGKVFSPDYNEDGSHINKIYNKNMTRKVTINGEIKNAPLDIEFYSKQALEEMGGSKLFEDIGKQLVEENDFDSNQRFKEHLLKNNFIDSVGHMVNDSTYDVIGKEFLKTEGMPALSKRYPVFSADSQIPILARLQEENPYSTSAYTHAYTAMKLNADTDGDMKQTTLLLERGHDGRVKIFNKSDDRRKAFESILEGEAIDNAAYWVDVAKEENTKISSKNNINPEIFKKDAIEAGATNGNWSNNDSKLTQAKVRFNKQAIGSVSNPNQYVSEIGTNVFTNRPENIDFDKFNDMQEFLKISEQKLISSKFMTKEEALNSIASPRRYSQGISNMTNGNLDEGFEMLTNSLKEVGLFDDNSFDMNKIKSYNYIMDKNIADDPVARGLGSLYQLFQTEESQKIWNNPDFRQTSTNTKNLSENLEKIVSGEFEGDSFISELTKEILEKNNADVEKTTAGKIIKTNQLFIDKSGTSHYIDNLFVNEDNMIFKSKSHDSSTSFNIDLRKGDKDYEKLVKNKFVRDLKATEINISGLNKDEIESLRSNEFSKAFTKGQNIIDDLHKNNIISSKEKNNLLQEFNSSIIEAGRKAKEFNLNKSESINKDIMKKAYSNFNSNLSENDINKIYDSYYSNMNVNSSGIAGNISKLNYKPHDTSNMYKGMLEGKTNNIDNYMSELENNIEEAIFSDKTYSSMNSTDINILKSKSVGELSKDILNQENLTAGKIHHKYLTAFEDNQDKFKKYAGWGKDLDHAISGIDFTSEKAIENTIDTAKSFGNAKISVGKYAGHKAIDLSFEQLSSATDDLTSEINKVSDVNKKAFYTSNIKALNNYKSFVGVMSEESGNKYNNVSSFIKEAMQESSDTNYSINMKESLRDDVIKKKLKDMNNDIKQKAREAKAKSQATSKTLNDTVDDIPELIPGNRGIRGKHLLIGAGIAITATMLGNSMGIAGDLDPKNSPSNKYIDDNQDITITRRTAPSPQQSQQVYMQSRDNYQVRAKIKDSNVNDAQISNAMNIAFGNTSNRVQINVQDGYDKDNKWFEKEISDYI